MPNAASPATVGAMGTRTGGRRRSGTSLGRKLPVRAHPTTARPAVEVRLELLSMRWRGALDAAERAVAAAANQLPPEELLELTRRLRDERAVTARILDEVARTRANTDPF